MVRPIEQQPDGTARVALTQGQFAIIDMADCRLLGGCSWQASRDHNTWYAIGRERGTGIRLRMHRVILDAQPGQQVDHIDGDGLNNRRSNLRFCNHSQNQGNSHLTAGSGTSCFRGVSLQGKSRRLPWVAQIKVLGKQTYLGLFATEEEAARAYDTAAKGHFGKFAQLNFPRQGETSGAALDGDDYDPQPAQQQG